MDELTFRRHVLANPFSQDAQVIQAAHQDPVKQQFWHDLKQQELALQQALQIDVPHDCGNKSVRQKPLASVTQQHQGVHCGLL